MDRTKLRRGYVDGEWGQIHYREQGQGPALVCLHATAYSSQTFLPLMPLLAGGRRVIAIDTPGYGASDGPGEPVPFEAYAAAIAAAIRDLAPGETVDLFGYHTGALLATEIAAYAPDLARRIVLIGVPFFVGADHESWRSKLVHRTELTEDFDQFKARWAYFITGRTPGLSLKRAFDCFVDELRAYPRDWWAHHALFDYDAEPQLRRVAAPVLIINPTGALAAASLHAASVLPRATVVSLPQLSGAIFDLGADLLAETMLPFLREPDDAA